jgi:cellulose synthase/poly-beta-1,6-N-acetylglucosamine synthase-like glycosyltransferase
MRPLRLAALATAGVLLAFTARRVMLLVAANLPPRPASPTGKGVTRRDPTVLILIPCRNDATALPRLLAAVDQLEYGRDRMTAVVVDDGSTDDSARVARAWAAERAWARVLSLPRNVGKAQALNEGLEVFGGEAEIVVVYDADHRPAPGSLRSLAAAFEADAGGQRRGQPGGGLCGH